MIYITKKGYLYIVKKARKIPCLFLWEKEFKNLSSS